VLVDGCFAHAGLSGNGIHAGGDDAAFRYNSRGASEGPSGGRLHSAFAPSSDLNPRKQIAADEEQDRCHHNHDREVGRSYPLTNLPKALSLVTRLDPLAYGVDGFGARSSAYRTSGLVATSPVMLW